MSYIDEIPEFNEDGTLVRYDKDRLIMACEEVDKLREQNKLIISELEKNHDEIQTLRGQSARHELETYIIEKLLDGKDLEGTDSDYETPLTDKIKEYIEKINKITEWRPIESLNKDEMQFVLVNHGPMPGGEVRLLLYNPYQNFWESPPDSLDPPTFWLPVPYKKT